MKLLITSILMLMMSFAQAAQVDGTLDSISPIKVKKNDQQIETYNASKLTFVTLKDDTIWIDQGYRTRCMKSPLGTLLEDIIITVKTHDGSFKTLVVEKETAERKIDIWGNCQKGSYDLEELVITVRKGSFPTLN